MFEKLKDRILRGRASRDQDAAAAYWTLVEKAANDELKDDAKSSAVVEETLAQVGVSFDRFTVDVGRLQKRNTLERDAARMGKIESELQQCNTRLTEIDAREKAAMSAFDAERKTVNARKHVLGAELVAAGAAMDKLRREHHDSPLAIAENRRRNRETASLRLVHLQRELTTLENFVLDRAAMLADVANLDERQHGHVILQRKNWLAEATARRDEKLREVERLTESATEVELVEV